MPCTYVLMAILYGLDVDSLLIRVQFLKDSLTRETSSKKDFKTLMTTIHDDYVALTKKSLSVNQFLSPILNVLSIFALPLVCLCLFISIYSDFVLFNVCFPFFAVSPCLLMMMRPLLRRVSDCMVISCRLCASTVAQNRWIVMTASACSQSSKNLDQASSHWLSTRCPDTSTRRCT